MKQMETKRKDLQMKLIESSHTAQSTELYHIPILLVVCMSVTFRAT